MAFAFLMFLFEGSITISILSAKALGIRRGSKPLRTDGSDYGSPNTFPAAELLDSVLENGAASTTCALQLLVWLGTLHFFKATSLRTRTLRR